MPAKASYLRRSSTGRYSYRRKVPEELAPYFPRTSTGRVMREWKQSFRTKDASLAQRLWVEENQKFDQAERVALALKDGQSTNTSDYEALQIAKQIAVEAGFHPDQAPKLPADG
jgi:lysophospholipase L1-like esterase